MWLDPSFPIDLVTFNEEIFNEKLLFHKRQAWNFIKKEALTQVFSYEFCNISTTPFSIKHLQ